MPKKERKETQNLAKQRVATEGAQTREFVGKREGERTESKARSDALYGDVTESARNLAATGGYGNLPETQARTTATELAKTGGFDPTQLSTLRGVGGTSLATGGYDMPQLGKVRSGFESLMEHGGILPGEEDVMLRSATRGVAGVYDVLGNEANRRIATTGGQGGGGQLARMARQAGQVQAEATTGARAEIAGIRQTGRIAGVQGLGGAETDFATGRRGAFRDVGALEGDVAAGRVRGGELLGDVESDIAGGRREGAAILADVYGMGLDEQATLGREILTRIQLGQAATANDMEILSYLSTRPGVWDNIIGAIGAGAGVASAVMTGGLGGSSTGPGSGYATVKPTYP